MLSLLVLLLLLPQAMSTLMAENKVLVERLNSLEREKGLRYKATTSTN